MGEQEFSVCSMCSNNKIVARKSYYYTIDCDCCVGNHFESVKYCVDCNPKPPKKVSILIEPLAEKI
jgi:hypothetical protein